MMVQNIGKKKFLKVGNIGAKDDILTVQQKQVAHIVNKTKISLEMTPRQRELGARRLKSRNMRTRKQIYEEK